VEDMEIKILGAESLGVRGLACMVRTGQRRIVIDPGMALGLLRHGLYPHPLQVAVAEKIRRRLVEVVASATDLVFSHFHGDHVPLSHPNPYQMGIDRFPGKTASLPAWRVGNDEMPDKGRKRCADLEDYFGLTLQVGEGRDDGTLAFSEAVPHGAPNSQMGRLMMTRVRDDKTVFVHASDIQLLHAPTIERILAWEPDIVLASGPPLYLKQFEWDARQAAMENALRLARGVNTLILDHHLLRDESGLTWLEDLSMAAGRGVLCAARFMGQRPLLLEAWREWLYAAMPVADDWHDRYARGEINPAEYLGRAIDCGLPELAAENWRQS
jgi:predicted metallo-beta-lactamase superfamily hydrolase